MSSKASFDTAHIRTNVVVGYAPHAGCSRAEKGSFDKDLHTVLGFLPRYEINIILGDFNVRLMERLEHGKDILGPHIFQNSEDYIEILVSSSRIIANASSTYVKAMTWYLLTRYLQKDHQN